LLLNWFPEAEHGGFYAAEVAGLYAEGGLDVDIQAGRPDTPVIAQVGTGRAEFGCANAAEVLLGRAQGVPVVAVAAPLQTDPRCVLVRASSPFHRLEDLRDVTFAMNQREPFAEFLRARLPLEGVRVVPYSGNIAQFLESQSFVQQAYVFSEPKLAEEAGARTRCLMVADLGFNPYAQMLITNERMIREQPEVVRAMTRAVVAGWERYLDDPGPTNQRIHALNPDMDEATLSYGARAIVPLARIAGTSLGSMKPERWETLRSQMIDVGLLGAGQPPASDAFDVSFLPAQ
jgi:NitT/TauT family transport system substrate-binding protein